MGIGIQPRFLGDTWWRVSGACDLRVGPARSPQDGCCGLGGSHASNPSYSTLIGVDFAGLRRGFQTTHTFTCT